jgi:formylglycine-generating enzyme required for sulfatase activity
MRGLIAFVMTLLAGVTLIAVTPASAQAREARFALVIANGAYRSLDRLDATYGDGDKVAAALTATGFADASGEGAVRVRRDLGQAEMLAEIAALRARLAAAGPDAFGMLYFSGHGVAVGAGGDVMMVATDIGRENLASGTALSRTAVTRTLMQSGAGTVLVVLDMCRNVVDIPLQVAAIEHKASPGALSTPGSKGLKRVIRSGDGQIRPDQGYLVAFSTSANQVAFDDGIFSKVLAEEIRRPQQNIADAMKRVSDRVAMKTTGAFQKPTFDYGLQGQPPCFVSCDPAAGDRFYDCANCPWMRSVPSGTGAYGSPASEPGRRRDEPLQQQQRIARGFALGVYEVTVAEWTACVRDGGCPKLTSWARENPNPLIPATSIGYDDARAFLGWLSAQSGRTYRLPTEAEWEYTSRAGASSAFPWGDEITPSEANYDHTARYRDSPTAPYRGYPEAVTAYPPNAMGFYQMQGNSWEWTSGCLDGTCRDRVVRGGSFQSVPAELRSANRFGLAADKRRSDVGLRVARDLDPDEIGGAP